MQTLVRGTMIMLVVAILVWSVPAHVSAEENFADLLDGIAVDDSLAQADLVFLQSSLQLLREHVPVWYAYIAQTKPIALSVNPVLSARGTAAYAECCDVKNVGMIVFGYRFGTVAAFDEPGARAMPARQIAFLGYLVHEATHIRDRRVGRIPKQMDAASCLIGEKNALTQEIAFKRALIGTPNPDLTLDLYRLAAQIQVDVQVSNLDDARYWERYCGLPTFPSMTNGIDFAQ